MKKVLEKIVIILVEMLFKEEFEESKEHKDKDQYTISSVYPSTKIMKEVKRTIR